MTFLRQRLAALSMLAALAVALGFAAFSASPASAQAPALELPPLPHETGVLAIRGDGTIAPDGIHLVISTEDKVGEIRMESGELRVEDDDGSFEVRAYVIGGNEATATVYVRTTDGEVVKSSLIYIRCEEADECMSASDFHVNADAGGSWLVDIEYGAGEHGAWQLEIYREVASEVLHLPPFPAPPVHAIRGSGDADADGRLIVTDSNDVHEKVVRNSLIVRDPDGEFDVVAYLEGADQAQVKVIVYADEPDGMVIKSELVTISCPDASICLQTRTITITAASGTYAFAVESVSGEDAGPWQLEVYNFVTPADDEESDSLQPAAEEAADAAEEDDGSMLAADEDDAADEDSMMGDGTEDDAADEDSMMGDGTEDDAADEDSMMGDGADGDDAMDDGGMEADETESDDAMALPTGGTGGLFNQASARTTLPLAVSLAGLIAGLAIFGIALRARRNSA